MKAKYKSRRFLLTVWAVVVSTLIMVFSILTKYAEPWLQVVLPALVAIPSVYIFGDSWTKRFENTRETQDGTETTIQP